MSVANANNVVGLIGGILTVLLAIGSFIKCTSEQTTASGTISQTVNNTNNYYTKTESGNADSVGVVSSIDTSGKGQVGVLNDIQISEQDSLVQDVSTLVDSETDARVIVPVRDTNSSVSRRGDYLGLVHGYYTGSFSNLEIGTDWKIHMFIKETGAEVVGEFYITRQSLVQRRRFVGRRNNNQLILTVSEPNWDNTRAGTSCSNMSINLEPTGEMNRFLTGTWSATNCQQGGRIDMQRNMRRRPIQYSAYLDR